MENIVDIIRDHIQKYRMEEFIRTLEEFIKESVEGYNTLFTERHLTRPYVYRLIFDAENKTFTKHVDVTEKIDNDEQRRELMNSVISTIVGGIHPRYVVATGMSYAAGMVTLEKDRMDLLRAGVLKPVDVENEVKHVVVHMLESIFGTTDQIVYEIVSKCESGTTPEGVHFAKLTEKPQIKLMEGTKATKGEGLFYNVFKTAEQAFEILIDDVPEEYHFLDKLKNDLQ